MILESLMTIVKTLITGLFSILPTIPNLPDSLLSSIDSYFNIIFSNIGLLGLFVHISTIKIILPIAITIYLFDKLYKFTIWLIKKIPFLNIH